MKINNKKNNFDFLRLLLAVIVAIVHLSVLSKVEFLSGINTYLSSGVAVDSFFVISGFLIFMSYESSKSITNYISKRLRRIFPGYIAVILFCSVIFYFASTKSGLFNYFNLEYIKYIVFNVLTLNFLQPTLPGVFENNQLQAVNGALWTIKIEVMFYMVVPLIAYIITKSNKLFVIVTIYILSILYSYGMIYLNANTGLEIFIKLERQLPGQLAFFISGAAIYYFYRYFYMKRFKLLALSLVILLINNYITEVYMFYPASLAIIVLFFATIFKYLGNFGQYGDLSFGVYIWHFPIIQIMLSYNLFSNQLIGVGMFITCTFIASYISWHLIEKRFLFKSSHYVVSEKK
jgi:peptidoglycan/LPS O-acetylase OafA/YrhL